MPVTLVPLRWPDFFLRSSQLNIAAALSSASFWKALVSGPWSAPILLDEFGRVDAPDRHPVNAELARGLVDHRLEHGDELVLARSALRADRRRVGQHRHGAPAHRRRLIDHRQRVAGGAEIAAADVRAVFLHDVEVGGEHACRRRAKPSLTWPWKLGRALPMPYSSMREMRCITGRLIFFDISAAIAMLG